MLFCPKCERDCDIRQYGAIRRVYMDGEWRAFRTHKPCETRVGLERRILAAV